MQIFGSSRRSSTALRGSEEGVRLRRSEMVSDLFNNRVEEKEDGPDSKLRLSYASRRLSEDLRQRVEKFLKQYPKLSEDFQGLQLPEELRGTERFLGVRRMSMYLTWLRIRETDGVQEYSAQEEPYVVVRGHGKDAEMRGIFAEYEAGRVRLQAELKRSAPHYYYMAYPETYSFN